jgi:competence protein ComEA
MKEFKELFIWLVAIAFVITFVPTLQGADQTHKGEQGVHGTEAGTININTASVEELTHLKGVGEKYAEAIVHYRKEHGPFKAAEEIINVPGIGQKTFEANKGRITVQ